MNKFSIFIRKNSSTILSTLASIGVVGTAVLAVKATPKALQLIEFENDLNEENDEARLTMSEKIKVTWKLYIPSILVGVSTIACIFGSNYINKKNQKALISAYMLLESSYLRYRETANNLYGKDADEKINNLKRFKEVANDNNIPKIDDGSEEKLYFDSQSMRYFRSTPEALSEALILFNQHLCTDGYAYLNDLYDLIGLDRVDYGYQIGWSCLTSDDIYSHDGIDIKIDLAELDDGLECWIISYTSYPSADFLY